MASERRVTVQLDEGAGRVTGAWGAARVAALGVTVIVQLDGCMLAEGGWRLRLRVPAGVEVGPRVAPRIADDIKRLVAEELASRYRRRQAEADAEREHQRRRADERARQERAGAGAGAGGGPGAGAGPAPDPLAGLPWRELGLGGPVHREAAADAFRSRIRRAHPDAGGSHADAVRVLAAWAAIRAGMSW